MIRYLTLLVGTLALAGLTHLATILLIPHTASHDMYQRLGRFAVGDGIHLIPASDARNAPLPFADPAIVMAVCRYDLAAGTALRMQGAHPPWYWSATVHDNRGSAYFSINNRALGERGIDMRVMPEEVVQQIRADQPDTSEQELLIPSPTTQGFILVRAMVPYPGARGTVEREVMALNCQTLDSR